MKICLTLDKDDVATMKFGENFGIEVGPLFIIFTPDALEELFRDYQNLKQAAVMIEPEK